MTDTTIIDVLDDLRQTDPDTDVETAFMRHLVSETHPMHQDTLSYEDWVLPMKLSGGRICLRLEWKDVCWYVRRDGFGRIKASDDSTPEEYDYKGLRSALDDPDVDVTPVLLEDTPFSKDDDG